MKGVLPDPSASVNNKMQIFESKSQYSSPGRPLPHSSGKLRSRTGTVQTSIIARRQHDRARAQHKTRHTLVLQTYPVRQRSLKRTRTALKAHEISRTKAPDPPTRIKAPSRGAPGSPCQKKTQAQAPSEPARSPHMATLPNPVNRHPTKPERGSRFISPDPIHGRLAAREASWKLSLKSGYSNFH